MHCHLITCICMCLQVWCTWCWSLSLKVKYMTSHWFPSVSAMTECWKNRCLHTSYSASPNPKKAPRYIPVMCDVVCYRCKTTEKIYLYPFCKQCIVVSNLAGQRGSCMNKADYFLPCDSLLALLSLSLCRVCWRQAKYSRRIMAACMWTLAAPYLSGSCVRAR